MLIASKPLWPSSPCTTLSTLPGERIQDHSWSRHLILSCSLCRQQSDMNHPQASLFKLATCNLDLRFFMWFLLMVYSLMYFSLI
uniref:Uncharacterized protein n=1 Tax=Cannabis sativa TaxID=3483 RepID=A0A803QZF6_CANSA